MLGWQVRYLGIYLFYVYGCNIAVCVLLFSGPDTLEVADSYVTWNRKQAVKLRTSDVGPQAQTPISIVTAFQQTVARFPDHAALGKSYVLHFLVPWTQNITLGLDPRTLSSPQRTDLSLKVILLPGCF